MLHFAETNPHKSLSTDLAMGRGDAKNKRKGNKGADGGEEKRTLPSSNADNATPVTKNPFANMLCDLSPYNLPQLRDAEAKYYARIESSKVEFSVFSTINSSSGVSAADLHSTAVGVACVHRIAPSNFSNLFKVGSS